MKRREFLHRTGTGEALLRGKRALYELDCHVPLLVRWPGNVKPGTSSAELILGEDLAPMLLEAAGAVVPKERSAAKPRTF
jgi:arylsulfatase A-like enzyme